MGDFVSSVCVEKKNEFLSFNFVVDRLDTFLGQYLNHNNKYINIWKVCVIVMTLYHGQSDVERVFSVNSEVLVENMKKISLVSLGIVYDHCSAIKTDLSSFKVTKELLTSCRGARLMRRERKL